jgi:hypothetical protein
MPSRSQVVKNAKANPASAQVRGRDIHLCAGLAPPERRFRQASNAPDDCDARHATPRAWRLRFASARLASACQSRHRRRLSHHWSARTRADQIRGASNGKRASSDRLGSNAASSDIRDRSARAAEADVHASSAKVSKVPLPEVAPFRRPRHFEGLGFDGLEIISFISSFGRSRR